MVACLLNNPGVFAVFRQNKKGLTLVEGSPQLEDIRTVQQWLDDYAFVHKYERVEIGPQTDEERVPTTPQIIDVETHLLLKVA